MEGRTARAPLGRRRLSGPGARAAVLLAVLAAVAETFGTVVTGRIAEGPTAALLAALAVFLVGSALCEVVGRTLFATAVGRAEGVLRADLLDAALHQPLTRLEEQGVGELLDRVDDDTRQLAVLLRISGWAMGRAVLRSVLAWVAAGLVWWPAWIAFPLVAVLVLAAVRRLTPLLARSKTLEEEAWSDGAAQLEEAVAGRDDVRTSLGQPYVLAQFAARAAEILRRNGRTSRVASRVALRSGLVLHGLLAALAVGAVALVDGGTLDVGTLVTLWLLVTTFVGRLDEVNHHLPEMHEGLGALARIRALMAAAPEPQGGRPLPATGGAVEVHDLDFTYRTDGHAEPFHLRVPSWSVPAGTTCALVGRSGAGKSTLAKLLSRAVEPPPGTVHVGGQDVTATDLQALRAGVGVVTQRTELLAATLAENLTLFADVPRARVEAAVAELGLTEWVAGLPDGLDTQLGPRGVTLSAGQEQLVAFARLLVRDVQVVVLDEATARMDPVTEQLVTRAAQRLLQGRTGVVVAHRLGTTRWCDAVAVLDGGRIVQQGPRAELATTLGPFRDLLVAAGADGAVDVPAPEPAVTERVTQPATEPVIGPGADRGMGAPADRRPVRPAPRPPRVRLARSVVRAIVAHPAWGITSCVAFWMGSVTGTYGILTGALWGRLVEGLEDGRTPVLTAALLAAGLLVSSVCVAVAFRWFPVWWTAVTLRLRLAVLRGQTEQHRLARTPPGEVTARALDSDRLLNLADRWIDVSFGAAATVATVLVTGQPVAGLVAGSVIVGAVVLAALGAPAAGRAGRVAGDLRAVFGRQLVSALEAVRTVKLAAATGTVQRHLEAVDARRVAATVRETRIRTLLEGGPVVLVQTAIVASWALFLTGAWDLATALTVSTAVAGFGWYGITAGLAVVERPIAGVWLREASTLAGRSDLVSLPDGVDLVTGSAPAPADPDRVPLRTLELQGVTAVHDDGTVGVADVDLRVPAGSLTLLVGRVGAGKSSLLAALAGLVDHEGAIRWNGVDVTDPQLFLRPGQVAHVAQVPRVLSGSIAENVALSHRRGVDAALHTARMQPDVADAGGVGALVGHRGVRLSGGQVQRLALARALATGAELVLADDVSSALDARTELELWAALRERGSTVVGASSKRAALALADQVVVLDAGRVVDRGRWSDLAAEWGHLAG
ncbi:ABC-type multidrug transport system, ATPase and permease component [Klenkia marina]|uniref:ABC-type multidrug transport system, ATPase and permease component n=1 Tax=Klenkia marina TaxID=1960309 RepID=A0A1G4XAG3_9ACTN|nr:ABC-type multidrug transport system, ATPase and permease component [Klenkia marina]